MSLLLIPPIAGRTANSAYTGMGTAALASILVYALVQTSLLEETVFRGFLLKRVAARWGFVAGNTVQAAVFGALHGVPLYFMGIALLPAIVITVFTGAIAAVMGWINERLAGGSLVPGYVIHALSNVFGGVLVLIGLV